MVRNKTTIEPINEQLAEVIHRLKHLEKNQQEIKSHLWSEPNTKSSKPSSKREHVKQEAVNYINSVVMPEIEAHQVESGEIGVQGLGDWVITQLARPVAEYLKAQLLEYISEALAELKKKAIPYAVQIADWVLGKLEDIIVKKYEEADEEQQKEFKEAINKHFPKSRLLEKLNG